MKDLGNTVIIVEHDKRFIDIADEIIDIGPGAGVKGGEIVYQGTLNGVKKVKKSYTGQFLAGDIKLPEKASNERIIVDENTEFLILKNARTNNLKNITVKIPIGMMVGIAGLSGSGKSSLILDTLVPLLKPLFKRVNNKAKKTGDDFIVSRG